MITITMNNDFTLNCDTNIIPAQHSANIPFKFEVPEEYQNSLVIPGYMYYDGCRKVESAIDNYSNGNFTLPANAFSKEGMLAISFAITTGEETVTTTTAEFEVRGSINTSFSLPSTEIWQNMLQNFMEQYMTKVYSSIIEDLIQKEQDHYQHTEELQIKVNDLVKKTKQQQSNVTDLINNVNEKIENGDFIPNLQIGTVENGSQASATFTGSKENPELNLVLPKGEKGEPGDVGPQGAPGPQGPKGDNGGMATHIVDTLPESGESTDIYFLIAGDNYIPFMYVEGKWIAFGTARPKQLLINNSFQINQRGLNTYQSSATFSRTLDGWLQDIGYYCAITPIQDGGMQVDLSYDGLSDAALYQKTYKVKDATLYTLCFFAKANKEVDVYCAVDYPDGIGSKYNVINDRLRQVHLTTEYQRYEFTFDIGYADDSYIEVDLLRFQGDIKTTLGTKIYFKYVDLFPGDVSYPHVKNEYTYDLMKCQQYVVNLGREFIGYSVDDSTINVPTTGMLNMANSPTIENPIHVGLMFGDAYQLANVDQITIPNSPYSSFILHFDSSTPIQPCIAIPVIIHGDVILENVNLIASCEPI